MDVLCVDKTARYHESAGRHRRDPAGGRDGSQRALWPAHWRPSEANRIRLTWHSSLRQKRITFSTAFRRHTRLLRSVRCEKPAHEAVVEQNGSGCA